MTDKKIQVWDGVLKCETCKLETCKDFQDIQDVSGIDCGMCEDFERDILKTLKHPFLKYYNAIKYYRSLKRTKKREQEFLKRLAEL